MFKGAFLLSRGRTGFSPALDDRPGFYPPAPGRRLDYDHQVVARTQCTQAVNNGRHHSRDRQKLGVLTIWIAVHTHTHTPLMFFSKWHLHRPSQLVPMPGRIPPVTDNIAIHEGYSRPGGSAPKMKHS